MSNDTKLKESRIEQQGIISQKEHDLEVQKKSLELKLRSESEVNLLNVYRQIEEAKKSIAIIEKLPEIASNLNIDSYTILDSNGEGFSPASKFIQEFISLLQTNKILPQKSDKP